MSLLFRNWFKPKPFVADGVSVMDSAIHGKGLFANRKIKAGEVLGRCRTKPSTNPGLYTLTLDAGEEVDVVCDLRYINHSPKPNAIYYDDLTVVALRKIKPGEEITHHYGDDWD